MTLKPTGDLTIFEVGALCEELKQAIATHPQVELDLSEVDKLDASAIQLLLAVRQSEHCVLTGIPDSIRARMADMGA
ncbi:MAG: STAS domain-containing protein [Nitrospira sp. CR1.2]|nr:STAS domain-containing protein [Nitrospira sp. CR1.2]